MFMSNLKNSLIFFMLMSMQVIAQQNQAVTNRRLARDNFKSKYGENWSIRWNPKTETPSSILGDKISKYKGTQIDAAKSFLNEEKTMLGISNVEKELLLTKQNTTERGGTRYIFSQVVDGIPVIGSGYNVGVANDGSIYFVNGDYYTDVNIDTKPSLSLSSVLEIIKKDLSVIKNLKIDTPELSILPGEVDSRINFKLVYIAEARADKPVTALRYTIDANSGEVLFKDELINKINGTGLVFQTNPNNGSPVTRTIHRLNDINPRKLDGDNVIVYNEESDEASSGTAEFNYYPNDTHFDEVMSYYHSDEFEDWLIGKGLYTFQVGKFTIHTHDTTVYAGTDSRFRIMYLSDGIPGLRNPSHEAAIICHEYMHGVSETINIIDYPGGSSEEGAMDEAYSDYFGVAYTNQGHSGISEAIQM